MKLMTMNVDSDYFHGCIETQTDGKGDEVLFVDFDGSTKQWEVIKNVPNTVRLIIFDRDRQITPEGYEYLIGINAVLLEPVVQPRFGFIFMPYYIDRLDLPLSTWEAKRPFDTGFKGSVLSTETEACLLKSIKKIKDISIGVSVTKKLHKERYETLKSVMSFGNYIWPMFCSTIIAGTHEEYETGVLPDITNHLKYGVVPLVYHKHRWFHGLFRNFIVYDHNDVSWNKGMYKHISYGMMDELYKNIETYMPQMFTENFVETIIKLAKYA